MWHLLEDIDVFRTFHSKRTALLSKHHHMKVQDPTFSDAVYSVKDLDAIHDLHSYLSFQYGREWAEASKHRNPRSGLRPLVTSDTFKEFRQEGIQHFLHSFLVSEVDFIENVRQARSIHTPPTPSIPLSTALQPLFPSWVVDPSKFLERLKTYVASSLFHHPELRKIYREKYWEQGELSIVPTDQGQGVLDFKHPFFRFKYIKNKPVRTLDNDLMLDFHEAEKAGWIQMHLLLEDQAVFFQSLVNAYATRGEGHEWNTLRISIFKQADALLTQYAQSTVKEKLLKNAIRFVANQCGQKLHQLGYISPYVREESSVSGGGGWDEGEGMGGSGKGEGGGGLSTSTGSRKGLKKECRVLALGLVPSGRQCTAYGALIHKKGQMEDFFSLDPFSQDWTGVFQQYHPEVLLIGVHPHPMLKKFIDMVEEAGNQLNLPLELMEDTLAKVYSTSQWIKKEFPDFKNEVRYCIGLGRILQEPMFVLSALFPKDIFQYTFHPKQTLVPEDLLLQHLEKAMIQIITEIGVDLNLAYTCPFTSHVLQFVSGLGPRKATGLFQKMIQMGTLPGRDALITHQCMGKIVFLNCSSFLRFSRLPGGYDAFDPLDSTRIHPEDYSLARKMAKDALDIDEIDEDEEVFLSKYVEELMEGDRMDALDDLALEDYALVIEQQTETKKRFTLDMIKAELKSPYKDPRPSFQGIQKDALFHLLIGDPLKKGTQVDIVITKIAEKYARCRIHNWIDGILWRRNVCEEPHAVLATALKPGQKKRAVVMELDPERYSVSLSLLKKDLDATLNSPLSTETLDPHFDTTKLETEMKEFELKANVPVSGPPILPLTAKHPLFRPFNAQQTLAYLKNKDIGEAIIRPSSGGNEHHFVISWVVVKSLLQHVPVVQDPNTKKYILRINTSLQEEYHDFDEILFKYVEACAKQISHVVGFRKFNAGTRPEVERILKREVKAHPGLVAYAICPNVEFPGYFSIIYMTQLGETNEMGFKVVPKGFSYLGRVYTTIEQVMNAFKNGFNSVS
ncbi:Transcription elongation factor spt6 [Coelomomyces lativittatus]|nr:Transcription elongation factor spt6 [Coelomomyces lativittatus]